MTENIHWRNRELRRHVAVIDGEEKPTIVLKNGIYLNTYTKQWLQANIWIFNDRIVYVGDELPENSSSIEVIDCDGLYLVPGYIEPHAHPFQLYNPELLAMHGAKFGTTTFINDNLMWNFLLDRKKAFTLLDNFNQLPVSMYWWARFDSQTALQHGDDYFSTNKVLSWLEHPSVIQGGELTAWPRLLNGDDRLLYWIQESNRLGKPVEGHLPGASEKTLTKMKLLGVAAEHEAMTGKEVIKRLQLGYQTGLRYSSIRPDLPVILEEMLAEGFETFDHVTLTTDGATPAFYENGIINSCIDIAIEKGVPLTEAYRMATHNAADHYGLLDELGCIAPGRIANINILEAKDNPHPISVLAKGEWILKDSQDRNIPPKIDWGKYEINPIDFDWDLSLGDMQFSVPIGLNMVNDVIIQPYAIKTDVTLDVIPDDTDDAFLMMIDRQGKWRVNTAIKGFTNRLGALASSYSTTGDLIFIGKSKQDMLLAWKRLKELGGGIVLVHEGKILFEMPLKLGGSMFDGSMAELMEQERHLKKLLQEFGYPFGDPVYSVLFLSATHLPYIRITQQGIMDVKKREVLFPATMR
ncbi:adenine deaminase C-terminal domain-containing protein [Lentibacillus sp. CBA3610]|uniref:adenine deaminase C-terminal domain-containing protein n=1 Tax=Lentibacillus sp. CBA3610 TaxID=2518176 RepID=UPI0015950EB4|nr:adenine deaminase C-terminal domain-containing protein [Lentibacillus sp. CBA3610]QKY71474.1 adenine deaminase [Lentibacillus sp. CBA3610]